MIHRRTALAAVSSLIAGGLTRAQPTAQFPNRPVRLVVPYPAGGITDSAARWVAVALQDRWGQAVVVDNRPGASGAIGGEAVAKAPPDGHTLMVTVTSMLQAPMLDPMLRIDVVSDFVPVTQLSRSALILVVSAGMDVQTPAQMMAALKSAGAKSSYGSIGAGSQLHLFGDQLARRWGVQPTHVPFKGAAPLMVELIAGRLDFAFLDFMSVKPHILNEKIKPIAVTGTHRSELFPAVPTLEESGIGGFDMYGWIGLFGPKAIPPAIVEQVAADVSAVMKQDDVVNRFRDAGMEPRGTTPAAFARQVLVDRQAWSGLVTEFKAAESRAGR